MVNVIPFMVCDPVRTLLSEHVMLPLTDTVHAGNENVVVEILASVPEALFESVVVYVIVPVEFVRATGNVTIRSPEG